jgi:hypothetical protein
MSSFYVRDSVNGVNVFTGLIPTGSTLQLKAWPSCQTVEIAGGRVVPTDVSKFYVEVGTMEEYDKNAPIYLVWQHLKEFPYG